MGGLCESDSKVQEITSTGNTGLPDWVNAGGRDLFNSAKALSKRNYTPYEGPRVAELSGNQKDAIQAAGDGVGGWRGATQEAGGLMRQGGEQWGSEAVSRYMNPYANAVTNVAARELQRKHDIGQLDRNAAAAKAGAFGSARHGVVDAEADRNLQTTLGDLHLRGQAAAYESALNAFQADRSAAARAGEQLSGLAKTETGLGVQDMNSLLQTGALERSDVQANYDTAYGDFKEQERYPYEQLNYALGALQGVPYETHTFNTTQQPVQTGSTLGTIANTGLAIYGAGNAFDWW